MTGQARRARVADLREVAADMPHVRTLAGSQGRPIYQVGGRSFVFCRNPRPDAVDPTTRERYDDVVVIWTATEGDKQVLLQDPSLPFFTTAHFDGHCSVLLRSSRIGALSLPELTEVVQDAWLSRASARRARDWLAEHRVEEP